MILGTYNWYNTTQYCHCMFFEILAQWEFVIQAEVKGNESINGV